jgi:hypothetical protein
MKKKLFYALGLAAALSTGWYVGHRSKTELTPIDQAALATITVGEFIELAGPRSGRVVNPEPIAGDHEQPFRLGDGCGMGAGGSVEIVARDGNDILLRYHRARIQGTYVYYRSPAEEARDAEGSGECPTGTLTISEPKEIAELKLDFVRHGDRQGLRRKVQKMMGGAR